jgi:SAM-dependent methyltransferase
MHEHTERTPAEIYEEHFVPALFHQWGPIIADAAGLRDEERVLDVACGTGVLALAAAARLGDAGQVFGLDPNEEMLAVARRKSATVTWRSGRAEAIPFPDEHFDAVVSQFGFMFFDDQRAALAEMMRVLKPGGTLALAVCDAIDHSPGYSVLAELLYRRFGDEVAQAIRAPFVSGDPELLRDVCTEAGFGGVSIRRHDAVVRFSSPQELVSTERACVWTLGGLLDDAQFEQLETDAVETFAPFRDADGMVAFNMPALIVTARKPG